MAKIRVYPYKQGSASAKTLAEALGAKVLKLNNSKYVPRQGDLVINWGSSDVKDFGPARILNKDVKKAQCKLESFKAFKEADIRAPRFFTDVKDIPDEAYPIICRTKLRGHSGDGIVVAETKDQLVAAPLYTQYVKKKDEYRVHVLRDKTFFIQRKARKLDVENPNWKIRNLEGGFVFVEVDGGNVPNDVLDLAVWAVDALGLDFGGVDVMWNENEGKAYVLEVNTACGLEERTAEKYKQAFCDFIEG